MLCQVQACQKEAWEALLHLTHLCGLILGTLSSTMGHLFDCKNGQPCISCKANASLVIDAEKQSVGQAAGNTKHVACEPSLKVMSGRCVWLAPHHPVTVEVRSGTYHQVTKSPDMSKEQIMTYPQTLPHFAAVTAPEIFQRMLSQSINIHRWHLKQVNTSCASTNTLEIKTME